MIKVSVDAAAAFDMLSILQIKYNNNPKKSTKQNILRLTNELKEQLGLDKVENILFSKQYADLKRANEVLFNIVNKLERGEHMPAIYVNNLNKERYIAKNQLQDIFFSNKLTEEKLYT